MRHACTALKHLGALPNPPSGERAAAVCVRLASVILSSPLGEDGWYSAAEAALRAVYALHATPAAVAGALLQRLAAVAFPSRGGEHGLMSWRESGVGLFRAFCASAYSKCAFAQPWEPRMCSQADLHRAFAYVD